MPKSKTHSILDYVCKSLDKLECKVMKKFSESEENPVRIHQYILLDMIIFRMLCQNWEEDELYEECHNIIKNAYSEKKRLDEKEASDKKPKTIH